MKFYNRAKEMALLVKTEQKSLEAAQMMFVVGRRRIGKTALLMQTFRGEQALYFFVEKKNEALLCEEFVTEIRDKLGVNLFGEFRSFKDVFGYLMELSQNSFIFLPVVLQNMLNCWPMQKRLP